MSSDMSASTIPNLSNRVCDDFIGHLSERQIDKERHEGGCTLNLWVRLTNSSTYHRGLMGMSQISLTKLRATPGLLKQAA